MTEELNKLEQHHLFTQLLNDSTGFSDEADEDTVFTEYEYYVRNAGFYCVHLLELCKQLDNAIELFSNFNYSKSNKVGRIEHLKYNLENYIIRLTSISDRMLQLINGVFHLGTNEKSVNDRTILTNVKVDRTDVPKLYKVFNKTIKDYTSDRNAIVHRHAYLDDKLHRFKLFYNDELTQIAFDKKELNQESFKHRRKKMLTDFILDKKTVFKEINKNCFVTILPIFDQLETEYNKQKKQLK
ncbi:MAG: Cthe_2314 family HEPN domain-containing protein [Crocinitomicaceae bacterium]|nr:Cthe_2314 family HEPN domain-containing protein [Crocinitomicaceae bacterium]